MNGQSSRPVIVRYVRRGQKICGAQGAKGRHRGSLILRAAFAPGLPHRPWHQFGLQQVEPDLRTSNLTPEPVRRCGAAAWRSKTEQQALRIRSRWRVIRRSRRLRRVQRTAATPQGVRFPGCPPIAPSSDSPIGIYPATSFVAQTRSGASGTANSILAARFKGTLGLSHDRPVAGVACSCGGLMAAVRGPPEFHHDV